MNLTTYLRLENDSTRGQLSLKNIQTCDQDSLEQRVAAEPAEGLEDVNGAS